MLKKHSIRFLLWILTCTGFMSCQQKMFRTRWTLTTAPEQFAARFETSKGDFDIQVTRSWSPKAADRFYQLIRHRFFDSLYFYRVVPGFVAQFGSMDTVVIQKWKSVIIPDEPVLQGNQTGRISFARTGKDSRGADLFINLKNNNRLDTITYNTVKGFPAFGEVTRGMETVNQLYGGYGDSVMAGKNSMYKNPVRFLQTFPLLDRIYTARIISSRKN
jgi:peptidyl-prolyl cis-trans isomerase A (cyclophilin A)